MSDIVVTLPDDSELSLSAGATVEDAAYAIGPGLGEDTIAGVVDGELVGKAPPLPDSDDLVLDTQGTDEDRPPPPHSAAH